jgi:TolA-binding protein
MATYKKKGQKKAKSAPVDHVEEESTIAEVFKDLEESASKSEQWVEKFQKPLFSGLVIVVALILGYIAYNSYIAEPKEQDAANELSFPKENFDLAINATSDADALYKLALEGTNGKYGFVDIASKYSGTKAGNLANYYAGISNLKLNNYKIAISYLEDFSSNDALLAPTALGAIGDAFADLNQNADALSYYEKAANTKANSSTTPLYLLKAGNTALDLGDAQKAEVLFTQIKNNYSNSSIANNIDMHINKAKYAQK